jgi:hypothetical protein
MTELRFEEKMDTQAARATCPMPDALAVARHREVSHARA